MRSTIRFLALVALVACVTFIGAHDQANPQAKPAGNAQPDEFPKLKDVPSDAELNAELAESVGTINDGLRDLYRHVSGKPDNRVEWSKVVVALNERLAALDRADKELQKLGLTEPEEIVREPVLRDRAQAFVHGWAIFSLATMAASRQESAPPWRDDLLALDRPADKPSSFATLLTVYREIRAGEKNADDPLRIRLRDGSLFRFEFAYNHRWKPDEQRPATFNHDRYIPAAADLVGTPDDRPEPQRELFSLWALVNRQLDTWNHWGSPSLATPPKSPGLASLVRWLESLASNTDLQSLEGPSHTVASFTVRVSKMHKFLAFREWVANDENLRGLLKALSEDRGRKIDEQKGPRAFMRGLVDAADSLPGGEYLADAAIWLRYLVLLSYQGEGWLVLGRGGENDLSPYWKRHQLPQGDFYLRETESRGQTMLRWHGWPAKGHGAHLLGDLIAAAQDYLKLQADIVKLEQQRYQLGFDYARRLRALLDQFDQNAGKHVRLGPGAPRDVSAVRRELRAAPGQIWCRSVTEAEESRLAEDLANLESRIQTSFQQQKLVLRIAEGRQGRQAGGALTGLAAFPELADCNLEAPIAATFDEHARRVRELYQEIQQQVQQDRGAKRLLRELEVRQYQAGTAEVEEEAARFALQAAEQSLEMARIYEQIAQLDRQIRDLYKQAREARRKGFEIAERAAGVRVTLATRTRDLAAAQLAALNAALEQAKKIIDSTEEGLKKTQDELRRRADEIEKEKRRSFIVGLIKAAIRIVGAALTPFTGGASLAIAQAATMAVDLAANADRMDWSNLGAIVQNVGTIAESGARITTKVVNVVGNEKLKQGWADIQGQFAKVQAQVGQLSQDAKRLLDGIPLVANLQPLITAVSGAAAGWPVEYKDGKLRFDVERLTKIQINDQELRGALDAVMKAGGVFVNNMDERVRRLSRLPVLQNEQLRAELAKALDELIKVAPPEVLDKYRQAGMQIGNAEEQVKQAKDRLKQLLNDPTKETQRQVLARILGAGMILVTDAQGNVVAIERPVKAELEKMKARAKALQQQVIDGAIGKVVQAIQEKNRVLTTQIEAAEREQNEGKLRAIAKTTVPDIIDELKGNPDKQPPVRGELNKLRDAITTAQGDLEDKQLALDAATFEQAAAQFATEAGRLNLGGAQLEVQNALNYERLAEVRRTRDQSLLEEKRRLLRAKERDKQFAGLVLRHAKDECIDYGIDPESRDATAFRAGPFANGGGTHLAGALFRSRDGDIRSRLLLRDLAGEFVGMLQWVHLLRLSIAPEGAEPLDAVGWYGQLVQELAKDGSADQHAKVVAQWAEKVSTQFREKAPSSANITSQSVDHTLSRIRYFSSLEEVNADQWLSIQKDENLRKRAVARIDFWVTNQPTDLQAIGPQTESDDLLAIGCNIELVRVNPGPAVSALRFTVVPPDDATPYPGQPVLRSPRVRRDAPVAPDPAYAAWERAVALSIKPWPEDPCFTGFYGEWTVYVFDTAFEQKHALPGSESDLDPRLKNYRDNLKLDVWVPLLRVKR